MARLYCNKFFRWFQYRYREKIIKVLGFVLFFFLLGRSQTERMERSPGGCSSEMRARPQEDSKRQKRPASAGGKARRAGRAFARLGAGDRRAPGVVDKAYPTSP